MLHVVTVHYIFHTTCIVYTTNNLTTVGDAFTSTTTLYYIIIRLGEIVLLSHTIPRGYTTTSKDAGLGTYLSSVS